MLFTGTVDAISNLVMKKKRSKTYQLFYKRLCVAVLLLETFRFKDKDDYDYKI